MLTPSTKGMSLSEDLQDVDMGQDVSCTLQGVGSPHPISPWVSTTHFIPC